MAPRTLERQHRLAPTFSRVSHAQCPPRKSIRIRKKNNESRSRTRSLPLCLGECRFPNLEAQKTIGHDITRSRTEKSPSLKSNKTNRERLSPSEAFFKLSSLFSFLSPSITVGKCCFFFLRDLRTPTSTRAVST